MRMAPLWRSRVGCWGCWPGGAGWEVKWRAVWGRVGVSRMGRLVDWYGPVAVNVYTARKDVCNGRVKNPCERCIIGSIEKIWGGV